jgi:hypothetical protein
MRATWFEGNERGSNRRAIAEPNLNAIKPKFEEASWQEYR